MASEINKRNSSLNSNNSEAQNRPTKGSKTPSDVELRARAVSTKINDGNIKAAVRIAASNDSLVPVNADTLKKLQGKHHESRENIQPPDFIEQHFVVDAKAVSKCILSFPSGSAGGPDKLIPQILKDLISPCTGEAGKKLLNSLTLFVNTLAAGKLPAEFRPYFFSANLFALGKKDDGVCPIAAGNTLRRLASKCAGHSQKFLGKTNYGHLQIGYGCNKGAGAAAHAVRNLMTMDLPEDFIMVKVDFRNAFTSISRKCLLESIRTKSPDIYNYPVLSYATSSYLFFGEDIILSEIGVQQGDPEGPPLFSDLIMEIISSLCSVLNIWYLDDGNIGDKAAIALSDLKKIISAAAEVGLELHPSKCEIIFLGRPTEDLKESIIADFNQVCPGIQETKPENLVILGAPVGETARKALLTAKRSELE